jgi:hypothetical protein
MAHGAGGNMSSKLLVELEQRLARQSMTVVRFNFLYTEQNRRAPDRRSLLEACWRSVAEWVGKELGVGIALGADTRFGIQNQIG